jgi:hypothetical protein
MVRARGQDRRREETKTNLEARPEGRRRRGRPRKSYEDGIEEIWRRKGKNLREMRRLAVDRGRWKEFVEVPLTLSGTMGKGKKSNAATNHAITTLLLYCCARTSAG